VQLPVLAGAVVVVVAETVVVGTAAAVVVVVVAGIAIAAEIVVAVVGVAAVVARETPHSAGTVVVVVVVLLLVEISVVVSAASVVVVVVGITFVAAVVTDVVAATGEACACSRVDQSFVPNHPRLPIPPTNTSHSCVLFETPRDHCYLVLLVLFLLLLLLFLFLFLQRVAQRATCPKNYRLPLPRTMIDSSSWTKRTNSWIYKTLPTFVEPSMMKFHLLLVPSCLSIL
jgi:hypothetical protein